MYNHFKDSKNILITGCGGGYDIFCGLDLMFNLIDKNKNVILGNYTFTKNDILFETGQKITDHCVKVTHYDQFDNDKYAKEIVDDVNKLPSDFYKYVKMSKDEYIQSLINSNMPIGKHNCFFPEYKLVKSLHSMYGLSIPIYCFADPEIKYLLDAYNKIIELENIDTIVLVDGGTDSLMKGCEKDINGKKLLGTPYEDISSIIAVHNSNAKYKFMYCLGFNIDKYHDVTDENFLMNTCEIIRNNGFIGSYMLNKNNLMTKMYMNTFMNCDPENSIVNSQVISSINGHYGNYTPDWLKHRLGNSIQDVHPFMSLYWIYHLDAIYNNLSYDTEKLKDSTNEYEILQLLNLE